MAMSQAERDTKAAAKRASVGEKELRHRVRPGIEKAVARIRKRGDGITTTELLQVAIMKMDLMGDEELANFLIYPRHEIIINENMARDFTTQSVLMIQKDPGDEVLSPWRVTP